MNLLYGNLTYKIRGAIFSVYNNLGFGHKEEVYQNALAIELTNLKILFKEQPFIKVNYKNAAVGNYRPDFLVNNEIILELKAVDFMPKAFETHLLNYLKSTGFQLGLLINFSSPKLYIKRLIWNNQRKSVINQRKSSL